MYTEAMFMMVRACEIGRNENGRETWKHGCSLTMVTLDAMHRRSITQTISDYDKKPSTYPNSRRNTINSAKHSQKCLDHMLVS